MKFRNKQRNKHESSASKNYNQAERVASFDWGRVLIILVALFFLSLWGILWFRFFYLQVTKGPEYSIAAQKQYLTSELLLGRRGDLLDRNGQVLATSIESYSLSARTSEIEDLNEDAAILSKILNKPTGQIKKNLASKKGFVWVERKISDRAAFDIKKVGLKGFYLHKENERVYPYKHLAGQLIGFVGIDNYGLEGLEASFEEKLSGKELRKIVQRDAHGARIYLDGIEDVNKIDGQSVQLSIDIQIQFFAETALAKSVDTYKAKWGGCLVVDVKSGDILAWAQYPFFNPNSYREYDNSIRRNRLAMDALEQGSTVKPFVLTAAFQEQILNESTVIDCENGKWMLANKFIRDTRPHNKLNVEQILRYSSNIGAAKIALQLGAHSYGGYLQSLGFGKRSGLPLGGENPGILRNPAQWPDFETATAAFGQGFSATTLQMAQAYLALANEGKFKSLQLVVNHDLRKASTDEQVFSTEAVATTLAILQNVVMSEDGGGRHANIPGLIIGGKTGTAQKAEAGSYGEKRVASFIGLVPAKAPEYLVVVLIDEPTVNSYGSVVAAPVFKQVIMQTLAYKGNLPDPAELAALAQSIDSSVDPAIYTRLRANDEARAKLNQNSDFINNSIGIQNTQISNSSSTNYRTANSEFIPSVQGLTLREAVEMFANRGIVPQVIGNGSLVQKQSPAAGSAWQLGADTQYILWLGSN